MPLTMQKFPRPSFKFERLLIGYKSKIMDRLSISILALISQPYKEGSYMILLVLCLLKTIADSCSGIFFHCSIDNQSN